MGTSFFLLFLLLGPGLDMSIIRGPSRGPGHCLPVRMHMRQLGSVASHFIRFLRHNAQAFVLGAMSQLEDEELMVFL